MKKNFMVVYSLNSLATTNVKPFNCKKTLFQFFASKPLKQSFIVAFICIAIVSCKKNFTEKTVASSQSYADQRISSSQPNIILFIADDFGYELPGYTGGGSYSTPTLDALALTGIRFTQCYSHPDGYPSRLALYTGKYNFRNYTSWGVLPENEKTIGNVLHDAGYATCFVGKWQCDGGDNRIKSAGYNKYRVFLPFANEDKTDWKYEYKNPKLYENGTYLPSSKTYGKYSEDMYFDYVSDFIDSNATQPFFIVYSHNLPRTPWSPTPDDPDFLTYNPDTLSSLGNNKYFPGMVAYLDKIIGKVVHKIDSAGLRNNTVFLFCGDNGTNKSIISYNNNKLVHGGKNLTSVRGIRSPLIMNWTGVIAPAQSRNLIDYTDFLPTLANIASVNDLSNYGILDGVSFYNKQKNVLRKKRDWSFCHWDNDPNDQRPPPIRYVMNTQYKLYDTLNYSKFYNIVKDSEERRPLPDSALTSAEIMIKENFKTILQQMHN